MTTINGHTTRATGTILTAAIYNADHTNHVTNAQNLNTDKIGGATPPVSDGHAVVFSGTTGFAVKTAGAAPILSTQIGTSGSVLGLLNANKTDSGNNIFSGNISFTGASVVFPAAGSTAASDPGAAVEAVFYTQHLNSTNVTTKSIAYRFGGRDTVNAFKQVGAIQCIPVDGNWVNGIIRVLVRIADNEVETLRMANDGSVRAMHVSGGLGYGTGAGGTVTQLTSKSTGVTLNRPVGQITMNNASLAAGAVAAFVVSNTAFNAASGDTVNAHHLAGGTASAYAVQVVSSGTNAFGIRVTNLTAGALAETPIIGFTVTRGATT